MFGVGFHALPWPVSDGSREKYRETKQTEALCINVIFPVQNETAGQRRCLSSKTKQQLQNRRAGVCLET